LVSLAGCGRRLNGQTLIDFTGQVRLSSGTTLPAQCAVGRVFFNSNAPAGANFKATNNSASSITPGPITLKLGGNPMRTAILFLAALSTALSQSISFPGPGMPASSGGGGIFLHHRVLTIDHTQAGGSTLTNFPVLVSLTLGAGKIQNVNCYDVILTSDSGGAAKVAWDPEAGICNPATGMFAAWVLIPSISSSVDTVFYVFYDNVAIGSPQNTGSYSPATLWANAGYTGVYHLPNGSMLTANDSTTGGNNGTLINSPAATAGQIDGAAAFVAASSQYISIPAGLDPTGTKTLSLWIKFSSISSTEVPLALDGTGTAADGIALLTESGKLIACSYNGNGNSQQAATSFSNGVWYHVVVQKTTQQVNKLYVNGADVTTADVTDHVATYTAGNMLGIHPVMALGFDGALDEVRLFNGTLTAGWITAEYNNQKSGSTFVVVGAEI